MLLLWLEIKLALTKEGFSDDVRKVIKGLKERNVNRVALITKLWEFRKKCLKGGAILPFAPFSSDEVKEVSSLLLKRVKEEKEGKEIAAVLAVCTLVTWHDDAMTVSLTEGGLAAPLVEIINSHRDEVDMVERGLFTAGWITHNNGKECVDCEEDVVVFVVKFTHPNISFRFVCSLQLLVRISSLVWASSPLWRRSWSPIPTIMMSCGQQATHVTAWLYMVGDS